MWACGGHGSKGWTFAPGSARLLADLVARGAYTGGDGRMHNRIGDGDGLIAEDYAPNRFFSPIVYARPRPICISRMGHPWDICVSELCAHRWAWLATRGAALGR